jgi:glycosyltransferase involved in cell wall biosynthesis
MAGQPFRQTLNARANPMDRPKDIPRLSVIIPVYNERPTIEELLLRVQAVGIDKEIVIVDDGSTDGTQEFLRRLADMSTHHNPGLMTLPSTGCELCTDRVIIVTSKSSSRRAKAIWRALVGTMPQAIVRYTDEDRYDPSHWWRNTSDVQAVLHETLGLLNLWIGFRVRPDRSCCHNPGERFGFRDRRRILRGKKA